MKNTRKPPRPVLLAAALLMAAAALPLLPGCGPFWVDPYITVKESSLNWVIIHYYNMNREPIRRIGVEIYGNGLVLVKKGTSELVSNDFAKHHKEDDWGNIKTFRFQIDPKQANDIFQNLVNFGVLDREKTFKASKEKSHDRFIAVKANLCNNTYSDNVNMFEEDPDLAEQLLDVVREFQNPAPVTARDEKAAVRAAMRARRKGVSPDGRVRASRLVCDRLLARPLGPAVAVYLAGTDEIDLSAFIKQSLARGVRLLAPRWTGETYALAELRGLSPSDLRTGPHGIREPREPGDGGLRPSAWIVPGLAFTRDGRRLGYGGGWYDRLLADVEPDAQRLGVAYPFQLVDALPDEPHDVRLTAIVTDGETIVV